VFRSVCHFVSYFSDYISSGRVASANHINGVVELEEYSVGYRHTNVLTSINHSINPGFLKWPK